MNAQNEILAALCMSRDLLTRRIDELEILKFEGQAVPEKAIPLLSRHRDTITKLIQGEIELA